MISGLLNSKSLKKGVTDIDFVAYEIIKDIDGLQDNIYKYPVITFIKTDGTPDIQFRKLLDPRQSDKKVLLFRSGYVNPYYDDGLNGVGDNIHALKVSSKQIGENIVKLFKSQLYQYIFKINKHSQYNHGGLMDIIFRDISELDSFDDNSIFNFFKITPNELAFIKKIVATQVEEKEEPEEESRANARRRTRKLRRFF